LKVRYVRAYFNSSDTNSASGDKAKDACVDKERVCEVKDVTEGHIGDGEGKAGDEEAGDDDEEDSRGVKAVMMMSPMGWTATLAAMVGLLD
jgi:hypothetical protein